MAPGKVVDLLAMRTTSATEVEFVLKRSRVTSGIPDKSLPEGITSAGMVD